MKQPLKSFILRLLGKEEEAVVVSFWSGDDLLARQMIEQIRELVPDRRHFIVAFGNHVVAGATTIELRSGNLWQLFQQLRSRFGSLRIGLAPVLFAGAPHPLRAAAFLLAPGKILAYNAQLERHHLRLRTWIASWLFLRGVPLDRIFLRPWWLYPWKLRKPATRPTYRVLEGRPVASNRRRVAVLSPYFPYPLSHGGVVRIYNLLREVSKEFDLFLFAFTDTETDEDYRAVLEFCAKIILIPKPRYREPRWSTLLPPEVCEFRSPLLRDLLSRICSEDQVDLLQVEYTHLASYGGDILVEHDVMADLYGQVLSRERSLAAWWDFFRWRRFEKIVVQRYRRVVAMSAKDALLLRGPAVRVIENGVDLDRFQPEPERLGQRLLFIGSFRHFPNVAAYLFFTEQIWPRLRGSFPELTLTVVAGSDHLTYWRGFTNRLEPVADERIRLVGLVRDVRPLYHEANLVIVPTTVSAGTNIKVLEAMAMERAVVSTSSGCAGLGLDHGNSIWIADNPERFAAGVELLLSNPEKRTQIAQAARLHVQRNFDWKVLGRKQASLYRELLQLQKP